MSNINNATAVPSPVIGWGDKNLFTETKSLSITFGIPAPASVLVEAIPVAGSAVPVNDNYWFDPTQLKKLLSWVYGKSARKNILLMGDAGVGKSSVIVELAARLGVPVFQMACSGKTRFQHFVGSRELVNGATKWVDGPLTRAMREGGILLLDEVTRLDPGEQMNLAAVLDERSTLTVPDTGEVIKPHALFRVAATGNSGGFGDESGAYVGEKPSSFAFIDRFQKLKINPMPEEEEIKLLKKITPDLPEEITSSMVKLASEVRKNFVGQGGGLSLTISPRSLQAWAREAVTYQKLGIKNPIEEALKDSILNGAPEDAVATVTELYKQWL